MAELLVDMKLGEEEKDCALNIQRSASSLLTVINDILDFSKVESGRLDIEEVQFSLSVVMGDVIKMMAFERSSGVQFRTCIPRTIEYDQLMHKQIAELL